MRCAGVLPILCASLSGCAGLLESLLPPGPNCEQRTAFWPDQNADGIGDPGVVYIGCEQPEGWVTVPPEDVEPPADTPPPDDPPLDSADTGPPDRIRRDRPRR